MQLAVEIFNEALKTLISMTLDCLAGGLDKETYVSNLEIYIKRLKEGLENETGKEINCIDK